MIRNIEKRKQLAKLVYESYFNLNQEEKKEMENEVAAAFKGYELALKDICQIIVDGRENSETLVNITDFITGQLNGKRTQDLFRLTDILPSNMLTHVNTAMRAELMGSKLMKPGMEEEEADAICKTFISNPHMRQNIIDRYGILGTRLCYCCGKVFSHIGTVVVNKDNGTTHQCCSPDCARILAEKSNQT